MRRYIYTATFEKTVTNLKLGSRTARIMEIVEEKTPLHPVRTLFVVCWSNRDGREYSRSFNPDNFFIISAYNGFVNRPADQRGRECYAFLNMLKRLEYEEN